MTTSVSLLEGLQTITNEKISFLCKVYHNTTPYFLCLARHSMLFLDKKVHSIKAEVYYASIERILLDIHDQTII